VNLAVVIVERLATVPTEDTAARIRIVEDLLDTAAGPRPSIGQLTPPSEAVKGVQGNTPLAEAIREFRVGHENMRRSPNTSYAKQAREVVGIFNDAERAARNGDLSACVQALLRVGARCAKYARGRRDALKPDEAMASHRVENAQAIQMLKEHKRTGMTRGEALAATAALFNVGSDALRKRLGKSMPKWPPGRRPT